MNSPRDFLVESFVPRLIRSFVPLKRSQLAVLNLVCNVIFRFEIFCMLFQRISS